MRKHCVKYHKLYTSLFVISTIATLTGCTTAWTTEAGSIIALLTQALPALLGILSAFGVGVAPAVTAALTTWATTSGAALRNVVTPLIAAYNTATADARAGILEEISAALADISTGLANIMPTIKVTDLAVQHQINNIVQEVANEINGLIGLVPALQGKIASADEMLLLISKVKTPQHFKKDFNTRVAALGPKAVQFQLK
jgi:hypothetical protein